MKPLPLLILFIFVVSVISCKKDNLRNTVTDIDGNVYHTITIGSQVWMVENLRVTRYRNGDPIFYVDDNYGWENSASGAYCHYDNMYANAKIYGNFYNWSAVSDARSIAPPGWHVPTLAEWKTLESFLGGTVIAGGKMKQAGTSFWKPPNTGADNSSGFTGLPGGERVISGGYLSIGVRGGWWSSTEYAPLPSEFAGFIGLASGGQFILISNVDQRMGLSVRCIKD